MKNFIKKIKASKTSKQINEQIKQATIERRMRTKYGVEALEFFKSEIFESYNQIYTKQGLLALIDEMIEIIQVTEVE